LLSSGYALFFSRGGNVDYSSFYFHQWHCLLGVGGLVLGGQVFACLNLLERTTELLTEFQVEGRTVISQPETYVKDKS
jgi:hypothetical protein